MQNRATFWAALWLVFCALPFAALPPLLTWLPMEATIAGLWLLVWPLCPALAVAAAFSAASRGVSPALAWLIAPVGYLILPLWGVRPEWPVLLAACLLGIPAGVAAEQYALRKGRGK